MIRKIRRIFVQIIAHANDLGALRCSLFLVLQRYVDLPLCGLRDVPTLWLRSLGHRKRNKNNHTT
jgi:hypothetical protein